MSTGVVLNQALPLPPQAGAVTNRLGFYITQVKCDDETNPELGSLSSDEIAIGGITVDETGDTEKVGEQSVGGGFDDGNVKNYSPHWQFTSFSLSESHPLPGSKWPKAYFVTLLLAEKDHGGFSSALQDGWVIVGNKVTEEVQKAVTDITIETGPAISLALGKIAAWAVNELVRYILRMLNDDLFPPYVAELTVPGFNYTFPGGSKTGPLQTAHFIGHDGHYTVQYYWKLYADSPVVYVHNGYGGRSQMLNVGRYDVGQLSIGNEKINSGKVPPGWTVTLYQEAGFWGNTKVLTANTPALPDFNGGTSSIIVERMAVVYEHIDYGGRSQVLDVGRYDLGQLSFGHDRITAVMVPSGWKVTLYENAGFQGRTKVLTADTPALLDFNDRTSSIVVERM
jgi:hypothetical protein